MSYASERAHVSFQEFPAPSSSRSADAGLVLRKRPTASVASGHAAGCCWPRLRTRRGSVPPRPPCSRARRAAGPPRAGPASGAAAPIRTPAAGSPARESCGLRTRRGRAPARVGSGSSHRVSGLDSSCASGSALSGDRSTGRTRRSRVRRALRQFRVAIDVSQVSRDERPSNEWVGLPGPEVGLLHEVLGVLHRAQHPVAVGQELRPEGSGGALEVRRDLRRVVGAAGGSVHGRILPRTGPGEPPASPEPWKRIPAIRWRDPDESGPVQVSNGSSPERAGPPARRPAENGGRLSERPLQELDPMHQVLVGGAQTS